MSRTKELLKFIRDGIALTFTWLIICSVAVSLIGGSDSLKISYIVKVFVLCLWAVISFGICFKLEAVRKKGFIFSLTLFYILFIPIEIFMFYLMGIFARQGSRLEWVIFGIIIAVLYITSVLVDVLIMRKKADIYTEKIKTYISQNAKDI